MRIALDTNRLTDLFQDDHELADRLGECDEVWIAALVLQHDLMLVTRDRHFERVPQLLRNTLSR